MTNILKLSQDRFFFLVFFCLLLLQMSGKTERATYKVYVGNLGNNGSKKELEREFERFGKLHDVWVARNPPGFAFCGVCRIPWCRRCLQIIRWCSQLHFVFINFTHWSFCAFTKSYFYCYLGWVKHLAYSMYQNLIVLLNLGQKSPGRVISL